MGSAEGGHQSLDDGADPPQAATPLSNLDLIRTLQDSKAPRSRKIEEAYHFIRRQEDAVGREDDDVSRRAVNSQDRILMAMPQFVSFLSEWVQSAVLWSSKPQQLSKINENPEGEESHRVVSAHLDARYWAILRWCLSSGHLQKFASVFPSLMRPLNLYVIALTDNVGSSQCDSPVSLTEDSVRSVEGLLLANERSFRPDLEHWISLASTALSKLDSLCYLAADPDEKMTSASTLRLIVCILEGFARFVSIHPNRRKVFTSLTENLLESLLVARGTLRNQHSRCSRWFRRLSQALEEILEKGLFHAAHVGSFQDVCTLLAGKVQVDIQPKRTEKKRKRKNSSRDGNGTVEEEDKDMRLSYHRLLFEKLDSLRSRGIGGALMELGWIFETYSKTFKAHQAADNVDVFGTKSKGKPQSLEYATNDNDDNNSKGEESATSVHDSQLFDKKGRNSEALFTVFAEFIGPFMEDFKSFHLCLMSSGVTPSSQQISSARVLLAAVAGLLKAAKTENTYVRTEDSTTQAQFSFLDSSFNTLVGAGKSILNLLASTGTEVQKGGKKSLARGPTDIRDEPEVKALFADVLLEMITALKYLIDLDYRVVENALGDVWVILLAEVTLQQESSVDHLSVGDATKYMNQEAIEVACQIIDIFSDLRQVDRALFSLCVTLRRFISQGLGASHPGNQSTPSSMGPGSVIQEALSFSAVNLEAMKFLVCARPLLLAISSAMQALPEGQVAEFLRLLTDDALETITLVDISGNLKQKIRPGNGESGEQCVTVGLKGLIELYCCMLENVKIVSTNSIQAGKAACQFLMQIVSPKLVQLIDFFALSKISKDDTTMEVHTNENTQAIVRSAGKCDSADAGITLQDDSLLNTWILVFLLRLYSTTQSLHRECISLMPPKAAKKASAALDGPPRDYLRGDITDILTHFGSASFLSGVGRGAVKVSHFLSGIERRRDILELTDCPALGYSLDCIAIQSLAQLSRQVEVASFLLVGRDDVGNAMSNGSMQNTDVGLENIEGNADLTAAKVQKKLQKLLKDLKKEGHKLAKYLLKEVGWQEGYHDATLATRLSNSLSIPGMKIYYSERYLSTQQLFKQTWNSVEATLTLDTLSIQRWNLLCKSFDIWAKYAAEEDVKKFIASLFSSSMKSACEDRDKNMILLIQGDYKKQITDELLCNALFYEEETFCRIFPSTFLDELKKSSLSAFGEWPFESYTSNSFLEDEVLSHIADDWSDYSRRIEIILEVRRRQVVNGSESKTSASKRHRPDSVKGMPPGNESKNKWSGSHLNALDRCVGFLGQLSALPSGYIKSSECATCAYTLLCFERLLMTSLLDLRAKALESSPPYGTVEHVGVATPLKLLKALAACRFALLALTSSDTLGGRNAMLLAVLGASFSSLQWLSMSIYTATICLVDTLEGSSLPAQETEDIMSSGKGLLYEVLTSTASLVTYLSEESFSVETGKSAMSDRTDTTKAVGENPEDNSSTDSKGGANVLMQLIDYQVHMVDQLVSSDFCRELNFPRHPEGGCNRTFSIGDSIKNSFQRLALASSLSCYFWSLKKNSEKFVKDSALLKNPEVWPTPSMGHAQKLGLLLSETLLRALDPAGSRASLLIGEHEVHRSYSAGEKQIKITVSKHAHRAVNGVAVIVDKTEDEVDIEVDLPLPAEGNDEEASGDEEDDRKDVEEMEIDGQKDSILPPEMYDDILREEFVKHEPATDETEIYYNSKSDVHKALLEKMLQASNSSKCEIIGELYLALAGIWNLESINLSCCRTAVGSAGSPGKGSLFQHGLPRSVNLLMGAGYWLLMKAAVVTQPGHWSHLGWLIGVLKYMDAMYCLTPHIKPPLPPLAFNRLFNMHVRLLGSLTPPKEQFRTCKLSLSLDVEDQQDISIGEGTECYASQKKDTNAASPRSLRTAVRESLRTLIRTASRQHLVLSLQSIMRALVGQSNSNHSSGLEICGLEGGKVGRGVAAGIECLSIAVEAVSGTKRLRLLANHFHEFFGAIFNIIEYVQGPHLFMRQESSLSHLDSIEAEASRSVDERTVDSGPVVLEALQILITTASRDTIFPMKACHVALALHCPARIFWPVYRSGLLNVKFVQRQSEAERLGPQKMGQAQKTMVVRIGSELGVKLYVSCCRLLCSVIRHHRRESGHCIALLGDSARVLLRCLEAPNWPSSDRGGVNDWSVKMAAYCASWLRRIYEEMGEHKETLGKYCSHFLSDYLSVLSGHGPHAAGLIREVEAALQPGAYVLVDACSTNDLQQLHAALGEGPRRNALLNLRRQYQRQFKYTGKV